MPRITVDSNRLVSPQLVWSFTVGLVRDEAQPLSPRESGGMPGVALHDKQRPLMQSLNTEVQWRKNRLH